MTVFDYNTRSSTIIIIIIIIILNYVSTALIISILSCIVISEQLERGCNLTLSLFYCCYICHFILLQDCFGVKEVVSAGSVLVTAGQDNINVSLRYLSTHTPIRFDKFWLLFTTTIMTTPSQDLDVALA